MDLLPADADGNGMIAGLTGQLLLPVDADEALPEHAGTLIIQTADGTIHWIDRLATSQVQTEQSLTLDRTPPRVEPRFQGPATRLSDRHWLVSPTTSVTVDAGDPETGLRDFSTQVNGEVVTLPFSGWLAENTLRVASRDRAGNQGLSEFLVALDNDGPQIEWQILDHPAAMAGSEAVYRSPVTLKLIAVDKGAGARAVTIEADGETNTLSNGDTLIVRGHEARLSASDALGNESQSTATWRYDTDPPRVVVDERISHRDNRYQVTLGDRIRVRIEDATGVKSAQYAHQFNDAPFDGWVVAHRTGLYRVKLRVVDKLDNAETHTLLFDVRHRQ